MRWLGLLVLGAFTAAGAAAHRPTAEAVIAELGTPAARAAGIVEVGRDATVPRLLLVRVGSAWYALAPERRRALANEWRSQWREAVSDGLVGVIDATSARPVVNYDGRGEARLAPPTPPAGKAGTPP